MNATQTEQNVNKRRKNTNIDEIELLLLWFVDSLCFYSMGANWISSTNIFTWWRREEEVRSKTVSTNLTESDIKYTVNSNMNIILKLRFRATLRGGNESDALRLKSEYYENKVVDRWWW